jgi:spore maturation protein CgeB
MNYRFQKITTLYPEFVGQFLSATPGVASLSYKQLYDKLVKQHIGWSDYYGRHLHALGSETQEIFASVEPLQKAWARENGAKYSQRGWLQDIVLAQVKLFQPDVVFLQDLFAFDRRFRQRLREVLGKSVFMIGYRSAPTEDYSVFQDLDLVLACVPNFVESMRRHGARAELLLHAFEPSILEALGPEPRRDLEFTFVGSLIRRDGFHRQRFELVENLMPATPLEVWGTISEANSKSKGPRAVARVAHYANRALKTAGLSQTMREPVRAFLRRPEGVATLIENSFRERFHPPVFGLNNFRVLASSKLTFNYHIDCAGTDAGNMRLFEGTGSGACLITDWKQNLSELFEPDVEVVTYRSVEECVEKVSYLLDHPSEYEAIAAAGQRRTLSDHNFARRAEWLDAQIRELLR